MPRELVVLIFLNANDIILSVDLSNDQDERSTVDEALYGPMESHMV